MSASAILLVVLVLIFAWSIGAHYTGACMGMPYGSGSIGLWPALTLMAALALAGAVLASHRVESNVGLHIVDASRVTMVGALVIVVAAFVLTTIYTAVKIPTSTIQILVFCVVGMALGSGIQVHWLTILKLAVIWVIAPPIAFGLGFLFTHGLDRIVGFDPKQQRQAAVFRTLSLILVVVGSAASFVMGANDVSNATGVLIMTHLFDVWTAGFIGGLGLLLGVLTWGKPLLKKVAFDIVHVDLSMASAAQLVQALVVFLAVVFGFFTSMNQALVGAMMGAGMARGNGTIEWKAIRNIVKGWVIAPVSGIILAFLLAKLAGIWFAM
ncbi:inorganic phosphate transporter family protein [Alicyclobacillus tolerans]|uniref:inorganic phosphate transporter n=1 Tax=Alicyclobacillus tolerans TaxID=90970 RepID=UPI001F238C44|nr:inorganic phosphate transporter [Alicyclobacillus tolerans]MCF8566538.1 inorganic phosphate transporter family protein [Alicyclobacillus tolerans]